MDGARFNGHPPLWVNATEIALEFTVPLRPSFNGHPPLWVNATIGGGDMITVNVFQWAPTLVGECYVCVVCTQSKATHNSFNGHPPLGVNATV